MNIFHFFAIDLCEWARPGGGAANGQNRPKYGGFPPACGACGAGRRGRASPARRPGPMEKVCRYGRVLAAAGRARGGGRAKSVSTRGRTARAGFPRAQARTGGKSIPVRQGFGRRRAGGRQPRGRARKISQRAGQDGAGGLPPRAGPDRWKKYAGTAGFWPPRGGRAGAGAQNRSARAGRGRTWSGGSIIVQAGGIPAAGAGAQNQSAREAQRTDGGEIAGAGRRAGGCRTAARALIIGTIQRTGLAAGRAGRA